MINHLPSHLYPLLREYLSLNDELCLLHTAKMPFTEWKREYLYLALNNGTSALYVKDENFRKEVLRVVKDPCRQISLCITEEAFNLPLPLVHKLKAPRFFGNDLTSILPKIHMIFIVEVSDYITDIGHFSHLSSLICRLAADVSDISNLADIRELQILSGEGLTADCFSVLGRQSKLHLEKCPSLTRVDNLCNIQQLALAACPNIQDIRPLKGIRDLSISSCPQISDISCLGNHYRLEIRNCSSKLIGYEVLLNIPVVRLESCDISDISVLQYAREVSLIRCNKVREVTYLRNAKKICLHGCIEIHDFTCLNTLKDLKIVNPSQHVDSSSFPMLKEHGTFQVELNNMDSRDTLIHYQFVHRLRLSYVKRAPQLSILATFPYLHIVKIATTFTDFSLKGLGTVHTVDLSSCYRLSSLEGLGNNRYVKMRNCPKVRDVSVLRHVPIVTIYDCSAVEDYSCLQDVPRLRILSDRY